MSICDFSYVLSIIFTVRAVKRVNMHDDGCAKFHLSRSNHGPIIVISRYFKMAAVRHLGFLKVGNFNLRSSLEAQYASPCQIYRRSVKPLKRYGDFRFFKMAAGAILDFEISNFELSERSRGSICVILRNFIEIGQTTAEIWLFFHF